VQLKEARGKCAIFSITIYKVDKITLSYFIKMYKLPHFTTFVIKKTVTFEVTVQN